MHATWPSVESKCGLVGEFNHWSLHETLLSCLTLGFSDVLFNGGYVGHWSSMFSLLV